MDNIAITEKKESNNKIFDNQILEGKKIEKEVINYIETEETKIIKKYIESFNESISIFDIEKIKNHLCDDFYCVDQFGNLFSKKGYTFLLKNDKTKMVSNEILDIFNIKIDASKESAYILYSAKSSIIVYLKENNVMKSLYKDSNDNDAPISDISCFTVNLKKINNEWKIYNLHKSFSRNEDEPKPRFIL